MTLFHFACAWVIRPDIDYDELMHRAAASECALVALAPISISNQGLAVLTFALQTLSEAHLVDFIQRVGPDIGLTHWYAVPESYFAGGTALYLNIVSPDIRDPWLAGMNAYGHHNAAMQRKLGEG